MPGSVGAMAQALATQLFEACPDSDGSGSGSDVALGPDPLGDGATFDDLPPLALAPPLEVAQAQAQAQPAQPGGPQGQIPQGKGQVSQGQRLPSEGIVSQGVSQGQGQVSQGQLLPSQGQGHVMREV